MRYLKPERLISRVSTELLLKVREKSEKDGKSLSCVVNDILEKELKHWKLRS